MFIAENRKIIINNCVRYQFLIKYSDNLLIDFFSQINQKILLKGEEPSIVKINSYDESKEEVEFYVYHSVSNDDFTQVTRSHKQTYYEMNLNQKW